jgi:hypothetical protein
MALSILYRSIQLLRARFPEAQWSSDRHATIRRERGAVTLQALAGNHTAQVRATWALGAGLPIRVDLTPRNHLTVGSGLTPLVTGDPSFDGSVRLRGLPEPIVLGSLVSPALRDWIARAVRDGVLFHLQLEQGSWRAELNLEHPAWVDSLDALMTWGAACERAWSQHLASVHARSGPTGAHEEERRLRALHGQSTRARSAYSWVLAVVVMVFVGVALAASYIYVVDRLPR